MIERDEVLRALQQQLDGRRFDSAVVLEVSDGGVEGIRVRFRTAQRLATHVVTIPTDRQSLATDHSVGEPLVEADASEWARGVAIWLEELLDTGLVAWGVRVRLADGTVAIDPTRESAVDDEPWEVSPVPLVRPGRAERRRLRWLAWRTGLRRMVVLGDDTASEPDPSPGSFLRAAGFDVGPGRRAHADGRLIAWLQLYPEDSSDDDSFDEEAFDADAFGGVAVGQAVVVWRDRHEALVELEHVETSTVPAEARNALLEAAAGEAADAGARWLDSRVEIPGLERVGIAAAEPDGRRRYDLFDLP